MALFSTPEQKVEKQLQKEQAMMAKYGLDDLTDPKDIDSVRKIVSELSGTGFTGGFFSNEKDAIKDQTYFMRAIVEQNFIMIRQLERLINK